MIKLINKQTISLTIWVIIGIIISYLIYKCILIKYYHVEIEKVKHNFIMKEIILLISIILGLSLYIVTEGINREMIVRYLTNLSHEDIVAMYATYISCQIAVCIIPLSDTDIGI